MASLFKFTLSMLKLFDLLCVLKGAAAHNMGVVAYMYKCMYHTYLCTQNNPISTKIEHLTMF